MEKRRETIIILEARNWTYSGISHQRGFGTKLRVKAMEKEALRVGTVDSQIQD